ncbi:hypothetical protein BGZ95_008391, partial [Linnemannia exigua]
NVRLTSVKVPRQDGASCGIIAAFAVEHDILFKDGCHGWEEKNIPIYRAAYLARIMGYEKAQDLPLLSIKPALKSGDGAEEMNDKDTMGKGVKLNGKDKDETNDEGLEENKTAGDESIHAWKTRKCSDDTTSKDKSSQNAYQKA